MKTFLIFLTLVIILTTIALGVNRFVTPLKRIEIFGLYHVYMWGSGWDEFSAAAFEKRPTRYAPQIIKMLNEQNYNSYTENAALTFADYVAEEEGVRAALTQLSEHHPNEDVVCLIDFMLNGSIIETIIIETEHSKVAILDADGDLCSGNDN